MIPVPPPVVVTPSCLGTATPAPATVLYAPTVPQPVTVSDIVGFIIQNTDTAASTTRITTFGQIFIAGKVQSTDTLIATFNGTQTAVQMDALATWPDGSVKLASIALQVPSLCANSQLPVLLSRTSTPVATTTSVSLTSTKPALSVTLQFTGGSYTGPKTVDLGVALQTSLASNPDYWLRGPLVTQARVDVPLADGQSASTSTLHLTADVSVFADGSAMADVQFNNDITTVIPQSGTVNPQPALPALAYMATIKFQGVQTTQTVNQVQYTNWHAPVWSTRAPQVNVQHDIAQLETAGAVLPYDLTTGVNNSLLQNYDQGILKKAGFGLPLAANGVTTYMPMTGGRPDIGFTTQYNTVWLLTQDIRAAAVAVAQSNTSGAVPWNYKLANGRWLTPDVATTVWVDGRGGPQGYSDGIANIADSSFWTPDSSHQPNLNYFPYLMTGDRWHLDRLLSQAAFNLVNSWPGYRCKTNKCNTVLNGDDQLRAQAWAFRELQQAAFIGPNTSPEVSYFNQTAIDNWGYVQIQQPLWASKQGEATGWFPGNYGGGVTAEWQQDFLTGVAVMSALMGDTKARNFVKWQQPWLSGRFIGNGMNPRDGCVYNITVMDSSGSNFLNTWVAIEEATVAANQSNGTTWSQSNGYYCALARSSLSGALVLTPADTTIQGALSWLTRAGAPYTDQAYFQSDPTFNIFSPK